MPYRLRPATSDDYDFLYQLLVATTKDYVDATWGWDDSYQQQRFQRKFAPERYQIVTARARSALRSAHAMISIASNTAAPLK